jgi:hypothetical protein
MTKKSARHDRGKSVSIERTPMGKKGAQRSLWNIGDHGSWEWVPSRLVRQDLGNGSPLKWPLIVQTGRSAEKASQQQ